MVEATVLLDDGEELRFTAADVLQAAAFIEAQCYPYRALRIVPVEESYCKHYPHMMARLAPVEGDGHG